MDERSQGFMLIVLSVVITVSALMVVHMNLNFESMGYVGVFVAMFISSATVILPVPGLALAVISGAYLDPLWVGIVGGLGSALGEMSGYAFGYGGSEILSVDHRLENVRRKMKGPLGFLTVFIASVIPDPLFDLVGIAAGTIRMPWWLFFMSCAAGKIIKVWLFAYMGDLLW